jgi:hypothetical protein
MTSSGLELFAHTPLESPDRMIRLLEARALGDGTFDYSLKTYIVGSKHIPAFYALSYEWGPAHPTFPITIDGKRFLVRENLRNFLDRIEDGGEDFIRPLWIDAICIDQTKVAERNEQVKIMGQIFSAASLVLAWIGPKPVENAALAEIAVELDEWAATPEYTQLSAGTLNTKAKLLSMQEPYGTMWNHLHMLCISSSYWNRLWVIQELIKADNKLLLMWGLEQISWRILSIAFKTIYEAGRGRRPSAAISGHWDIVESSVPYSVWMHSQGLQRKHGLLQTMDIYRDSKCSVNHDKAYALTGISADSELLQIDYDKSLPDLYADLMNLEPRTPQALRYSHLVLEALHIEERAWESSGLKSRTVQCDAEKVGTVMVVGNLADNATAAIIQTEVWQIALEAAWTDPLQVEVKSEWANSIYEELKRDVDSFRGASLFCLGTGQMGIALLPTMVGDTVYCVQGLNKYSKIDLKYSGTRSDSAATRVWLTAELTRNGQEVREQSEQAIDLSLGDLYAMDHLLEIDFVVEMPSSPTDEAPSSPVSTSRRTQSDTAETRRLHRSSTLSQSIDEAMGKGPRIRSYSTWPTESKAVNTDGWYIDALSREMRDKLFTGTSPLGAPE